MDRYIDIQTYCKKYDLNISNVKSEIASNRIPAIIVGNRLKVLDQITQTEPVEEEQHDPFESQKLALRNAHTIVEKIKASVIDNQEIIRFSEKSLNTITSFSQTMLDDREKTIAEKDQLIAEKNRIIEEKNSMIKMLQKQIEDFSILTDTVVKLKKLQ